MLTSSNPPTELTTNPIFALLPISTRNMPTSRTLPNSMMTLSTNRNMCQIKLLWKGLLPAKTSIALAQVASRGNRPTNNNLDRREERKTRKRGTTPTVKIPFPSMQTQLTGIILKHTKSVISVRPAVGSTSLILRVLRLSHPTKK